MNYELSLLINYFLVFIESICLMTFADSFFQRKINRYKTVLALIVLTSLNFICIDISDSNTVLKLIMTTCVGTFWLTIVYRASVIKCIGVNLLFVSFISAADSLIAIGSTMIANIDIQILYQDPFGYYLMCYIAKIIEVLMFTVIGQITKQKIHLTYTTWQQWLKIFILPFASLIIAIFLWRLYWIFPLAAGSISLCTIVSASRNSVLVKPGLQVRE